MKRLTPNKLLLTILLLGGCATGGWATDYIYNGPSSANADWDNPTNYLVNGVAPDTFPNASGDTFNVTASKKANDYRLNGNRTIGLFKKTVTSDASTAFVFGTVTNCTLTWDTGVPGSRALFQTYGGQGNAGYGDLRCASYVHYVLVSDLLWQGSCRRGYANRWAGGKWGTQGNGQLWGDISGPGKLFVQWNACKADLYGGTTPMNMAIEGGTTNTHVGGTEFGFYNKGTQTSSQQYRAGFNLNKTWATGRGDAIVNFNAELYIANTTTNSNSLGIQDVIKDTTFVYLLSNSDGSTNATIELNNTTAEQVGGLYLNGVRQADGTWGSSSSSATHVNDTFFRGTGVLSVVTPPSYTITASAGTHGVINPAGAVTVYQEHLQSFAITPELGYVVSSLLVDGVDQGPAITNYTFTNITASHTISASFVALPPQTITASAGPNGSISPSGAVTITAGTSQTFAMTPNYGYMVSDVVVDGASIGATNSYTFTGVIASHTISASFAPIPQLTIAAAAGANGAISPSGNVAVFQGSAQSFLMLPNPGYAVADVQVDGASQGELYSYRFANVQAPHTISVSFRALDMNIPQTQNLLVGAEASVLPGDSNTVFSWTTVVPAAGMFTNVGGAPTSVVGIQVTNAPTGTNIWENNVGYNGDGFKFVGGAGADATGKYFSSIQCSGATIVAVVAPHLMASDTTNSLLVDVFYNQLSLGFRRDNGALYAAVAGTIINGDANNPTQLLPDGQASVISLVAQPDGAYVLRINGQVALSGSRAAWTDLVQGHDNDGNNSYINVGRNVRDAAANANIGDVFVYKTALSYAERDQLEATLMAKYNISPSGVLWSGPNNGTWNNAANWQSGAVPAYGQYVVFSATNTAGATVQLDTYAFVANLQFNNLVTNTTLVSDYNTLALDNVANRSYIETKGGSHTINAALSASLGLQKFGPGKLTLGGTSYLGLTTSANNNPALVITDTNSELAITGAASTFGVRVTHGATLSITGSLTSGDPSQDVVIGEANTPGQAVLSGTGSWTVSGSDFILGDNYPGAAGTLTVNDSATLDLTAAGRGLIVAAGNNGGSSGALIQNGGTVRTIPVAAAGIPGVVLGANGNPCYAEYDLNGGSLITPSIYNLHRVSGVLAAPVGSAIFKFNGGVLQASQSDNLGDTNVIAEGSTNLMGNLSHAYVSTGGAKINTDTNLCGINQALEHDPALGETLDGGLTKQGTGTLTLYRGSTYTGPTRVQAGVLVCATSDALGGRDLDLSAGTQVALNYTGTQPLAQLTFNGGAPQPAGTYGATGSGATYIDDVHFSGAGTLTVGPAPTPVLTASGFTRPGGVPTFTFDTVAGYKYRVVYKNALSDTTWQAVAPGFVLSTGASMTVSDTAAAGQPQRFYRLEVQ